MRSIPNEQIQLPAQLVAEVGYPGDQLIYQGPEVSWYYHPYSNRPVLSDKQVNQDGLEPIRSVKITGIQEADLQADDPDSGRITIPSELPEKIYNKLAAGDEVVLEPRYRERQSELESTCVIVHPAADFHRKHLSSDLSDPFPMQLDPGLDSSAVSERLSDVKISPDNDNACNDSRVRCFLK